MITHRALLVELSEVIVIGCIELTMPCTAPTDPPTGMFLSLARGGIKTTWIPEVLASKECATWLITIEGEIWSSWAKPALMRHRPPQPRYLVSLPDRALVRALREKIAPHKPPESKPMKTLKTIFHDGGAVVPMPDVRLRVRPDGLLEAVLGDEEQA